MTRHSSEDEPSDRPLKRTRQACEPCRRKKTKCSGERPVCSTCHRLRHPCVYAEAPVYMFAEVANGTHQRPATAEDDHEPTWQTTSDMPRENQWQLQNRLESLESTLAELVHGIKDGSLPLSRIQPPALTTATNSSTSTRFRPQHHKGMIQLAEAALDATNAAYSEDAIDDFFPTDTGAIEPPPIRSWEAAVELANIYQNHRDCQPLPLFHRESFVSTFPNRPLEVVYAVLAGALRFAGRAPRRIRLESVPSIRSCTERAHTLAMESVTKGRVEISTLQALCLLALLYFNEGEMVQCRVHASLAMTLSRSARLHREPSQEHGNEVSIEERRRCYWSIVLLHRLIGEPMIEETSDSQIGLPFPSSATSRPAATATPESRSVAASHPQDGQKGIISLVIQLSEIWSMAQQYVRTRGGTTSPNLKGLYPWNPASMYSRALESLMSLSSKLPSGHRYRSMRFASISSEELEESCEYWAPWILSRLLYHTSICVLNHPILIMLQLQGDGDVSELFLQQTTFARAHHTSWLLHFFETLDSKSFYISDPVFGYSVAVLATIELYQIFIEEKEEAASKRKENYELCLKMLRNLSDHWPYLKHTVHNLQCLIRTTSTFYQDKMASQNVNSISVDISGFLQILLICDFCSTNGNTPSIFGSTLSPRLSSDIPHRANLAQLPLITRIDGPSTEPVQLESLPDLLPSAADLAQFQMDDEMFLPAEQFFSGLYHAASL